ncbi:MAG: hypothetical protein AAB611_01610 [Patescibacteria group bacterium]
MNKVFLWTFVIVVISVALYASGIGLQALASVMTIIIHPWILFPVMVVAVIIMIISNGVSGDKPE